MNTMLSHARSLFLITLFFYISPLHPMEQELLSLDERKEAAQVSSQVPRRSAPRQYHRYHQYDHQFNQHAGGSCCDKGMIGACALMTVFGLYAVCATISLNNNTTRVPLAPCVIPDTIDMQTKMNDYCWSDCINIGKNPILCGTQAYSPLDTTAGALITALEESYGSSAQACLTTYDCTKIDNKPYNKTLNLKQMMYGTASTRAQTKRNNKINQIFKHQRAKH